MQHVNRTDRLTAKFQVSTSNLFCDYVRYYNVWNHLLNCLSGSFLFSDFGVNIGATTGNFCSAVDC